MNKDILMQIQETYSSKQPNQIKQTNPTKQANNNQPEPKHSNHQVMDGSNLPNNSGNLS